MIFGRPQLHKLTPEEKGIHEVWCEEEAHQELCTQNTPGHVAVSSDPKVLTDLGPTGHNVCKIGQEFAEGGIKRGHVAFSCHPEAETLLGWRKCGSMLHVQTPPALYGWAVPFLCSLLAVGSLNPLLLLTKSKINSFLWH